MMTENNFVKAERLLGKNKRNNRRAKKISANAEKYGKRLFELVKSGRFHFHKNREITIHDSYKGKTRNLKIPCLMDQAVQLAWLNIATPYIEKRNYYYNCGSVPPLASAWSSPLPPRRGSPRVPRRAYYC